MGTPHRVSDDRATDQQHRQQHPQDPRRFRAAAGSRCALWRWFRRSGDLLGQAHGQLGEYAFAVGIIEQSTRVIGLDFTSLYTQCLDIALIYTHTRTGWRTPQRHQHKRERQQDHQTCDYVKSHGDEN